MTLVIHPLFAAFLLTDDELRLWCRQHGYQYEMIAGLRDRRRVMAHDAVVIEFDPADYPNWHAPFPCWDDCGCDGKVPRCHAGRDGDCRWSGCPQIRDKEPAATGRHCPLDNGYEED